MSNEDTFQELTGLVVPVCTPFDENNKIDAAMYAKHLELLESQGVSKLLVNGTTAEFFSLTIEERKELLLLSRKNFSKSIMFHAGCDGLEQTIELAEWAQDNGADAIVSISPYYLAGAGNQGLINYFNELAEHVTVPLILYNFPKHTQNGFTPEILSKINHFGMKDSSADISLVEATPRYYMGGDEKILTACKKGAFGFVCARANGFAPMYVELERALLEGDLAAAEKAQAKICQLKYVMTSVNGVVKIKYTVAKQIANYPVKMRLPLLGLTAQEETIMQDVWGQFGK